jgi:hypothetical protein
MNQVGWQPQHSAQWCSKAVETVARIERVVQADHESFEPVLGRLLQPETSMRTHMAARRAVAALVAMVEQLPADAPPADELLESVYQDLSVPLTHRCLLRAVAMDAFSHVRHNELSVSQVWEDGAPKEEPSYIHTDVFALPAFGLPQAALHALSQPRALARLCALVESTGFVGENSVALLSVPLKVSAIHRVDVLRALMSMVNSTEPVDGAGPTGAPARPAAPSWAVETLAAHVPQERGPFLIAGVRVCHGSSNRLMRNRAADPLLSPPAPSQRAMQMAWWSMVVSRMIIESGVRATDLVLRPPAAPVRAQVQARAMGLVHDIYDRLAGRPFTRLDFEHFRDRGLSSSPLQLALSAFGPQGKRIASTRGVSLFDVGLGEDFQDVLQEEFSPGSMSPRTMSRQELMESYEMHTQDGGDVEIRRQLGRVAD